MVPSQLRLDEQTPQAISRVSSGSSEGQCAPPEEYGSLQCTVHAKERKGRKETHGMKTIEIMQCIIESIDAKNSDL